MAATTTVQATSDRKKSAPSIDPGKWLVVLLIGFMTLLVLDLARDRIVAPFDRLVTEQMCLRHGEETERILLDFERSNRFALRNRTDGYCSYGPSVNGDPAVTMTVQETEPGALYTWAKAIGIVLQLGIASLFIRVVTEPLLETYRFALERFNAGR